jgi:hypothetical protein
MSKLDILKYTAIIVAPITLFGTLCTALIPKLWDYWMEKRKAREDEPK